ncbi:serine hydrolase domain-containing protein [Streptomyces millisiae]|uniref:Serine hydrolase domain-containing protein n=1 Tax=Streptomyces millisiae TaxID=3075542 RepID=A0ABU2LY41_9ACTN|nr:serine hydrolase domain-containing protein [Streptomyces sp. DSM 44918]MDT0322188.1 serine hydrolase domain-containing protein [Streptomyces sp. DSM 44918]
MAGLREILGRRVADGALPAAVALVAGGDHVEVAAAGPVGRDSVFRIASLTKPVTAAAVLALVDEGRIGLADPVGRWLPELAAPDVVRHPAAPVTDVVPAERAITVEDLLSSRAGYGFPADFSLPAARLLFEGVQSHPLEPQFRAAPDEWLAELARVPLLHQPGESWLYNTCSDLQGLLVERVTGRPLPEFLAERFFEPLGMVDTGFAVPAGKLGRFTTLYRPLAGGGLEVADEPGGQWSRPPAFPSGAGGLVSTVDDLLAFARLLLDGGRGLLSAESVRRMTTDQLTAEQREAGRLFLEGQGWGYGGSVDVAVVDPWNVPGRYGWVGGSGTAAHLVPATRGVAILLTQVCMTGPTPPPLMREFWRYAAGVTSGSGDGAGRG